MHDFDEQIQFTKKNRKSLTSNINPSLRFHSRLSVIDGASVLHSDVKKRDYSLLNTQQSPERRQKNKSVIFHWQTDQKLTENRPSKAVFLKVQPLPQVFQNSRKSIKVEEKYSPHKLMDLHMEDCQETVQKSRPQRLGAQAAQLMKQNSFDYDMKEFDERYPSIKDYSCDNCHTYKRPDSNQKVLMRGVVPGARKTTPFPN